MSPDFPKDLGLADSLAGAGFVVVSAKVKEFLDARDVTTIEYSPYPDHQPDNTPPAIYT